MLTGACWMSKIFYDTDYCGDDRIVVESDYDSTIMFSVTNGVEPQNIKDADRGAAIMVRIGHLNNGDSINMTFNQFAEVFKFVLDLYEKTPAGGKVDE